MRISSFSSRCLGRARPCRPAAGPGKTRLSAGPLSLSLPPALALAAGLAAPAEAKPVVFGLPFSAEPGDVVSLAGAGFGTSPTAVLQINKKGSGVPLKILAATDNSLVVQIPKDQPFAHYSFWISDGREWSTGLAAVNSPRAMHFDRPEVAPGTRFKIYGRSLYLGQAGSAVTFVDQASGATLSAAILASSSDAYALDVVAPASLVAGRTYQVRVSNGLDTTLADKTLLGRAGGGDYYGLGQPWGADFVTKNGPGYQRGVPGTNEADNHVIDVMAEPTLSRRAKGDGVTDDTAAIQAAIDLVGRKDGGGIVLLPPGTYRIAARNGQIGLTLRSGVVIQGAGTAKTKILIGPDAPQPAGFVHYAFNWPNGTDRSGLADLSIQNIDRTGQAVVNAVVNPGQAVTKLFLQRVSWDLGSGLPIMLMAADKVAILGSTFTQTKNSHWPQANGNSGAGPLYLTSVKNLVLKYSSVTWESGHTYLNDVSDVVIEGNTFTRRATDQIVATAAQASWPNGAGSGPIRAGDTIQRTQGRHLVLDLGKNMVVLGNLFQASDGVPRRNWSDGEVFYTAGGSYLRSDTGTVTAAGASSVTDDSRCASACSWNVTARSQIAIVSGQGTGQLRRVVGRSGNTLTIDRPWDVVPQAGDRFQVDVPGLENAIIRYNTMQDNPAGILIQDTSAVNVAIASNRLVDNGGIQLRAHQRTPPSSWPTNGARFIFNKMRNIEITGNVLSNTKGRVPAFVVANFALLDPVSFWGTATDTVEIRDNTIKAFPGTSAYGYPQEGYSNIAQYANWSAAYVENEVPATIGTVLQGNSCHDCTVNYQLSTGVESTVIWNPITTSSPGVSTQCLADTRIWSTATGASVDTVIGRD